MTAIARARHIARTQAAHSSARAAEAAAARRTTCHARKRPASTEENADWSMRSATTAYSDGAPGTQLCSRLAVGYVVAGILWSERLAVGHMICEPLYHRT